MKERKILFDIAIADKFDDRGLSTPVGDFLTMQIPIDFDWDEKEDVMDVAERALGERVKSAYPGKDYRIYYWWWREGKEIVWG